MEHWSFFQLTLLSRTYVVIMYSHHAQICFRNTNVMWHTIIMPAVEYWRPLTLPVTTSWLGMKLKDFSSAFSLCKVVQTSYGKIINFCMNLCDTCYRFTSGQVKLWNLETGESHTLESHNKSLLLVDEATDDILSTSENSVTCVSTGQQGKIIAGYNHGRK